MCVRACVCVCVCVCVPGVPAANWTTSCFAPLNGGHLVSSGCGNNQ